MYKTLKTLIIVTAMFLACLPKEANSQVFDLSSSKKKNTPLQTLQNEEYPVVYKPSKLIIGTGTKFTIKAPPETKVSLITSNENSGYPLFFGKNLRIGRVINPYEGTVGETGVLELEVPLPAEKELVSKILYFEVLAWKKSDFSDIKVAKIMGIDGMETDVNAVVIDNPPKKTILPGIGGTLPGTGIDVNRTMEAINRSNQKDGEQMDNSIYNDELYLRNAPLIERNLRNHELKK